MPAVRVVPSFNPGEDRQPGLGLRLPDPAINELILQRRKEAFRHRVVIGISQRPHGRAHIHFLGKRLPNAMLVCCTSIVNRPESLDQCADRGAVQAY